MNPKKAQITAFIITGIVILAIVAVALLLRNYVEDREPALISDQSNIIIQAAIDTCVEQISEQAILEVSRNGLYFEPPENTQAYNETLWLAKTINIMPTSFIFIERNFEDYAEKELPDCLATYGFANQGWNLGTFEPTVEVSINDEDVSFKTNYNLVVSKEDFEQTLTQSFHIVDINFKRNYKQANHFVNNQLLKPDFDVTNPLDGYEIDEYILNSTELDSSTLLFTLIDVSGNLVLGQTPSIWFVANFDTNRMDRTYAIGAEVMVSPDRLATLIVPNGLTEKVTITQYQPETVTRENTPLSKTNSQVDAYGDVEFVTDFPIYRFGPNGYEFPTNSLGILTIQFNEDMKYAPANPMWLYNGRDSWNSYPFQQVENSLITTITGFSEHGVGDGEHQSEGSYDVTAEEDRNILAVLPSWVNWVFLAVAIIFTGGLFLGAWAIGGNFLVLEILVAALSYLAGTAGYLGIQDYEADKSLAFTGTADGTVLVSTRASDGDCGCTMTRMPDATTSQIANEGRFTTQAGKQFTISSKVSDFDSWKTSASCTCTVTGPITSNNAEGNATEAEEVPLVEEAPIKEPEVLKEHLADRICTTNTINSGEGEINGTITDVNIDPLTCPELTGDSDQEIGCCVDTQGTCHENFYGGLCSGQIILYSCEEINDCEGQFDTPDSVLPPLIDPTTNECNLMFTSANPTRDVYLIGQGYNNPNLYTQQSINVATRIIQQPAFGVPTIFNVKQSFEASDDKAQIQQFAKDSCRESNNNETFIFISEAVVGCTQDGNKITLNPNFFFDGAVEANWNDFCSIIKPIANYAAPVINLTVEPTTIDVGNSVTARFNISDEDNNIKYKLTYSATPEVISIAVMNGTTPKDVQISKTFPISTPGTWYVEVTATDIFGMRSRSVPVEVLVEGIGLSLPSEMFIDTNTYIDIQEYVETTESAALTYSISGNTTVCYIMTLDEADLNIYMNDGGNPCEESITFTVASSTKTTSKTVLIKNN